MSAKHVTVVLPTYNRPAFLREALASVLSQDYRHFSVLVADDASSYDVDALVSSFGDPRISLHRHRRNLGLVRNWHWCLCTPTTRYVAILEDDCLWLPHHLSAAIEALEHYPEAPFYCCASEVFGGGQHGICKPHWPLVDTVSPYGWQDLGFANQWLVRTPMTVSSVVLRRNALEDLNWGGKTWPWCQDYLTWGQLALKGPLVVNPHIGARYRWHEGNIGDSYRRHHVRAMAQLRYTMRFLATRAYHQGGLRNLAAETANIAAAPLSTLLLALAAPETPKGLSQQAHKLFKTRVDLLRNPECTTLFRIAARLGDWALSSADVAARLHARWWPLSPL